MVCDVTPILTMNPPEPSLLEVAFEAVGPWFFLVLFVVLAIIGYRVGPQRMRVFVGGAFVVLALVSALFVLNGFMSVSTDDCSSVYLTPAKLESYAVQHQVFFAVEEPIVLDCLNCNNMLEPGAYFTKSCPDGYMVIEEKLADAPVEHECPTS